jgi:transcriptional regulator with XRE-family HTH domain
VTSNPAIALVVAKPKKGDKPPVPTTYVAYLIGIARQLGWDENKFAEKADMAYQTLYRARDGHKESSALAVRKLRNALLAAGENVHPVPIDVDEWTNPDDVARAARPKIDPEAETIRVHLAAARERAGIDVYEVNARTGIPVVTIQAYEEGTEMVPGTHLRTLAKLYGYKTDDIVEPVPLPKPDLAARAVIHMRTDDELALELLTPAERERLEAARRELLAINEAARQRAAQTAKKPKR